MSVTSSSPALGNAAPPAGFETWADAVMRLGPAEAARAARGSFAVAVPLPDGRVFLAVDRFAVRTICWRLDDGSFRFAARADELGGSDLDLQALFDYLYFHVIPSPRTVFRGVQRLPAGHYAVCDRGQVTVAPYWKPRFEPAARPSYESLRAEFRRLLRDAIAAQLDGSPPACFLSGGTDSSTVAGHLRQVAGRAATYSIGFDAEGYDEMAYARLAARHFGAEHHEYYVTPDDLVKSIAEVAGWYDQPFGNSSALPAYYCALRAKADGVTRLLAGDGGDELFGGNSRYATQRLYGLYGSVPAALRGTLIEPLFGNALIARTPILKKGASYLRDAKTPLPDRMQHYNLLRRLGFGAVLTPAFLDAVSTESVAAQQRAVWALAEGGDDTDRMLAYDWRYTLAEADLPKVRETTALAGLSVAFPMLDDALVDFSMRLPTSYKLKGLKLRWFFKEALSDFLPREIITKQKKGFGLPFGVWATKHGPLKALALDSLDTLAGRGLVRADFLRELLGTHLPQHPGYYGEMVWILMMLEQWLRRHAPGFRLDGAVSGR